MNTLQWSLDLIVMALLVATLVRARRLDRALTLLQRDRSDLAAVLSGFDAGARDAREGIAALRQMADGVARQIARQTEAGVGLKDDLALLVERGERLADRLDQGVRAARLHGDALVTRADGLVPDRTIRATTRDAAPALDNRVRSQAERDLLAALRLAR